MGKAYKSRDADYEMGKLSNSIILHDRVVYGSFKKKPTIG
jgi:hypothetical protein